MSLSVRLNIFSGRSDPVFHLPEEEAKGIIDSAVKYARDAKPVTRGLGYKGFTLLPSHPDSAFNELFKEAAPEYADSGLPVIGVPELEERLVRYAIERLTLPHAVIREIIEGFKRPPWDLLAPASGCPKVEAENPPAYDPAWWNNNQVRLTQNNCYNYANNQATNTFAQPGRASGVPMAGMSCAGVQPSATADGLVAHNNFSDETPGWYVALVIWPGMDFHWYRQDSNGCWSHKPGSTPVINTDNSGNTITDPATCDRGNYTSFCTYMITNSGVNIA